MKNQQRKIRENLIVDVSSWLKTKPEQPNTPKPESPRVFGEIKDELYPFLVILLRYFVWATSVVLGVLLFLFEMIGVIGILISILWPVLILALLFTLATPLAIISQVKYKADLKRTGWNEYRNELRLWYSTKESRTIRKRIWDAQKNPNYYQVWQLLYKNIYEEAEILDPALYRTVSAIRSQT